MKHDDGDVWQIIIKVRGIR